MTSASERLRALMDAPYPYRVPTVMAALPLIADVVEAAEEVSGEHILSRYEPFVNLSAALTALRDALEEK